MARKYGFSFSWKRATGLSGAKSRLSRKIGVPLTRGGLERKIGRAVMGRGCCFPFILLIGTFFATIYIVVKIVF